MMNPGASRVFLFWVGVCKAATSGRGWGGTPGDFSAWGSATDGRGFTMGRGLHGVIRMSRTLGYHLVKSGYGLWLPGDERGSWSEAWDRQIGFHEPHTLHEGDPERKRMAEERMKHPAVRLGERMIEVIAGTLEELIRKSNGGFSIAAAAIEPTHMHLLIPYSGRDIENTAKWIADQTTKAIHRQANHGGPVWCKGRWRGYVFGDEGWGATRHYIEQHNARRGLPVKPYEFIL